MSLGLLVFLLPRLSDSLLHFPAWLKGDEKPFRHRDLLSRAGIAGLPSLTLLDLEDPEIAQLDPAFLYQRLDNPIEDALHDVLDPQVGAVHVLGNCSNYF